MVSVASGGTADRIAARILFKVLRAGSGTAARYSSTFFGATLPFVPELRLPDFTFFMQAMLPEPPLQFHTPDQRQPSIMTANSGGCAYSPPIAGRGSPHDWQHDLALLDLAPLSLKTRKSRETELLSVSPEKP